jgi:hypothetical protein
MRILKTLMVSSRQGKYAYVGILNLREKHALSGAAIKRKCLTKDVYCYTCIFFNWKLSISTFIAKLATK